MDRKKLDTLIEKEAHLLTQRIKDHSQSFVQLYARRTNLKVEPALLDRLTEILGLAIEDGFQTQIDFFNQGVGKALDKYTAEEGGGELQKRKK